MRHKQDPSRTTLTVVDGGVQDLGPTVAQTARCEKLRMEVVKDGTYKYL